MREPEQGEVDLGRGLDNKHREWWMGREAVGREKGRECRHQG